MPYPAASPRQDRLAQEAAALRMLLAAEDDAGTAITHASARITPGRVRAPELDASASAQHRSR